MSRFLQSMEQSSRTRLELARADRSLEEVIEEAARAQAPRTLGRFGDVFDLIAEIKPRSPAEGELGDTHLLERVAAYVEGGAGMLSVLTEPEAFGGSLKLLRDVAEVAGVPVMRKDFLVDPFQVFEARAAGADGVLIIARILSDEVMDELLQAVERTGMFALVEAFDLADLTRIAAMPGPRDGLLVGVNCRDLDTLRIEPSIHGELAGNLPLIPAIAESGILNPPDVQRVAGLGYRGALVGSALMRSTDPVGLVASMLAAGREAVKVAAS